jgi:GxxExxY protein
MHTILQLCGDVRQIAYAVHEYFGHGHLEKVYENALAHRLRKAGYEVEQQSPLTVRDVDGTIVGEYFADLIVNAALIIELKAAQSISPEHEAQIVGYLKAIDYEHGMLINFGSFKFFCRKFIWTHAKSSHNPPQ